MQAMVSTTNTNAAYTSRNGYALAVRNVTIDDALAMIPRLDDALAPFVDSVRAFAPQVMAEITTFDALRAADDKTHAQAALLFALCSPQCKFQVNVRAAQRMLGALYNDFACVDDVYRALTADGTDSWITAGSAARSIHHSLDFLRNVADDDMHKSALAAYRKAGTIKGLGDKTQSMAIALYDATRAVFTLDVHMLRGLCRAVESEVAGSMTITTRAYNALEIALVQWSARTFADLPVFCVQWALWNCWGFSAHVSHLGIFGVDGAALAAE